jgi:predicted nucleotidyltransferase
VIWSDHLEDGGQGNFYRVLLQELVEEASHQEDIVGMLLTGSVARGDALPGSDLDMRYLLPEGQNRPFQSALHRGIVVERSYADLPRAQSKLEANPMEVYAYLDGRILFDPMGILRHLTDRAKALFENYQFPLQEVDGLIYWLRSASLKMTVAQRAGNLPKAAFVCSTTTWHILMGLWAVNDKPMPPNGSVLSHLKDFSKKPLDLERQINHFFCGETSQRIQTAIDLINWILEHLKSSKIET